MRERRYDLVVIGGGAAGLIASLAAAGFGARVALVEADKPGGDCLYYGCVPSKTLIASARRAHEMRTADWLGLDTVEPEIDFGRVMGRIDSVIEAAGKRDSVEHLRSRGVEVVPGHGRFVKDGIVEVEGSIGTDRRRLFYRKALIATGSRALVPPITGLASSGYLTNETLFKERERPARFAVLGGGPVGVEMAQAFARLGSEVTLVEALERLLPREEEEASRFVEGKLEAEGVEVHTGSTVTRVEPGSTAATLVEPGSTAMGSKPGATATVVQTGVNGPGKLIVKTADDEQEAAYDRLLVAVGRCPVTEDLGLDSVGVRTDGSGAVAVNRYQRTTGSHIYAAGDVTGKLLFTHVAAYQALAAVGNALFRARRKIEYEAVPWVTFTDPEVARVGITEAEARDRLGREPLVFCYDYAESDRALTAGEAQGFAKLVADRRGRLMGATIVAPAAGESIAEVARLIQEGRKVKDLSQMIHAYPTFTEGPARAADQWWDRRYFNPKARRYFRPLLALLRAVDRPREQ